MSTFITDINRQGITLNGVHHPPHEIPSLIERLLDEKAPDSFEASLGYFLKEWFAPAETLRVHTSGSTGKPKELQVEKQRMMNSACMTVGFLNLQRGDSALLCMPLKYIAGKMVVVRALVAGLNLITIAPCGHPLHNLPAPPDFAALIPMQVFNSLQVPAEADCLRCIKHLIIGGGAIDATLEESLKDFPYDVWSTYGMTETLSHIALRRLNGPYASPWYTPLPGVRLSQGETLIIDAPAVSPAPLVTNDIARFNSEGQFRIIGRRDNTINTGGVKVQIEEVEAALRPLLTVPFFITSMPDPKFGERIVLLTEAPDALCCTDINLAFDQLPPYWRPKSIIRIAHLPLTGTGKPDRAAAKRLAARSVEASTKKEKQEE